MKTAYIKTRETILRGSGAVVRMRRDENGVVSFEYLIVAACIIAAVSFAFGTTGANTLGVGLVNGITTVVGDLTAAL